MTNDRKYFNAMLHGRFFLYRNAYFTVRPDIGCYVHGSRLWRINTKAMTTDKEMNAQGYVRQHNTVNWRPGHDR